MATKAGKGARPGRVSAPYVEGDGTGERGPTQLFFSQGNSMSDVARSFPTASHVFVSAPAAAAETFDLMILDPAMTSTLTPTGPVTSGLLSGYRPIKAVPATLHLPGRHRPLAVRLELLPWSQSRSELTMWSRTRPGIFLERHVAAYLEAAHASLRTLAGLLNAEPVVSRSPRHALPAARDRSTTVAIRD